MNATTVRKSVQERVDEMALVYYKRLDAMDAYDNANFFCRLFMRKPKDSARQFIKDVNDSIIQEQNRQGGRLATSDFFPRDRANLAYGESSTGVIFDIGVYRGDSIIIARSIVRIDSVEGYANAVIEVARRVENLAFEY